MDGGMKGMRKQKPDRVSSALYDGTDQRIIRSRRCKMEQWVSMRRRIGIDALS